LQDISINCFVISIERLYAILICKLFQLTISVFDLIDYVL